MIKNYFYSLAFLSFTIFQTAKAQVISTVAGTFNGDGYSSTAIGLNAVGTAVDTAGNLFIAVPDRHVVVKLSTSGIYSTVAGNGVYGFKGDGGAGAAAQLRNPWHVAVDTKGNVYIADNLDNRIRKVSSTGIITTIAGTGQGGFSGDGGLATAARLQGPAALAVDGAGNIFIADYTNRRVRKIATNGIISTIAGNGVSGIAGDNGPATAAQLGYISAIAVNSAGELFIADNTNSKVRKVGLTGIITSVAGSGVQGFSGDGGVATAATFSAINGVAPDKSGNLFIADSYNNRIRKVNTSGIVTTVAGNGGGGFSGDGGLATGAQMYRPTCLSIDKAGNVLISGNFRVRKLNLINGIITTIAGNGTGGYCGDGGAVTRAQLYHPVALTADAAGNTFFVDRENHRIRKISNTGVITTVAGNGTPGFSGDGGSAASAQLNLPTSVAVDKAGNLFITDYTNNRIRKVSTSGIITTISGVAGAGGFNGDGVASVAKLWGPDGVATDASGNVFFADQYNNRIRKITVATGTITTIAGSGVKGFSGDGGSALLAALYWPNNVRVDRSGNVLIGDRRNNRVRNVSTLGIITTIAGRGTQPYGGDGGSAVLAGLDVASLALDTLGNIFIADSYNERIRRVNKSGIISTLVSAIRTPTGIATDPAGNVLVTEYDNNRIIKISLAGVILSRSVNTESLSSLTLAPLKFSVYPNPVQNILNIQTTGTGELSHVEVVDVAGKVLLSRKVSTSQRVISIPLQRLTRGIYFVRTISTDGSVNVKEIMKD